MASRKASQIALEHFTAALPELLGGSADLTGSNLTNTKSTPNLRFDLAGNVVKNEAGVGGRHINYGVREFGMAAIMNGVALHGGFIPYGGTFLTFSDYSRNAIRMAALMKQRVVHVFTHDSIGLGEDGPTHQSIEHVASLRLIPGLDVWRPADTAETAVAWAVAPADRQPPQRPVPVAPEPAVRTKADLADISKGGYVLSEPATWHQEEGAGGDHRHRFRSAAGAQGAGTAGQGTQDRRARGLGAQHNVFDRQSAEYKAAVLPKGLPRVAVEMGSTDGWWKYGVSAVVGIDTYGESAPAPVLFKHFGFTPRTWPTRCGPCWRSNQVSVFFIHPQEQKTWLSKSVSTVLAASAATCCALRDAELRRHRNRRHQRPARAGLPGLHAAATTACTAASRAPFRSKATPWSSTARRSA